MIWNLTVPQQRRKRRVKKKKPKVVTNDDEIVMEQREAEMLLMHAAENLEVLRSKQLSSLPSTESPKESPTEKTHKRKTSFGSWFSNVFSSTSSSSKEMEEWDIDRTDESAATAMNKMVISMPTDENIIISPAVSPKKSSSPSSLLLRQAHSLCCKRLKRARLATAHVIRSLSHAPSEIRTRFESFCDECYCEECCGTKYSKESDNGWCELGLHVDSRTYVEGKDVFNKWNVAYHGFPHQHLVSIVLNGLAFPGDRIKVGDEFVRVKKPKGHSRDHTAKNNIFMSPSIHCAGCPLVYVVFESFSPRECHSKINARMQIRFSDVNSNTGTRFHFVWTISRVPVIRFGYSLQ